MALFQKEDKATRKDESRKAAAQPAVAATTAPVATVTSPQKEFQAQLGQGSRIEGRLSFESGVRIDGNVDGEITAKETVVVGESADVSAQIQAATVIILGTVKGDVSATKRVELKAPGKLTGNLTTPALVIHEGVTFEGHCTMTGAANRDKGDNKVALFPTEERTHKEDRAAIARVSSEAASK